MADTLHALGDLLIRSIPTVLFFIFLTYFLKAVFFRPLAAILEERRKATEGVRELAQRAMEAADKKNAEFEYALQLARGELQAKHDAKRREWADEQARVIAEARTEADRQIAEIKGEVSGEVKSTETELDTQVERLGEQIVDSLMRRRAA